MPKARIALGALAAALSVTTAAAGAATVRVDGFSTPESVLYDRGADRYLVSNIGGPTAEDELAADDDGFISKVAPNGRVIRRRWIDGRDARVRLDSPHGMAVRGNRLYVADLTSVRVFDRRTGRPITRVPVPDTVFLNDLAVGADGSVYVTDTGLRASGHNTYVPTGTDAVYRIRVRGRTSIVARTSVVARGAGLHNPNGIVVLRGGRLRVAAYDDSGEVYTPTPAGGRAAVQHFPGGALDGLLVLARGRVLTSSGAKNVVYERTPRGRIRAFYRGQTVADMGYDDRRDRVLMPLYFKDAVLLKPLR